jgi:hypothetical protein
MSPPVRSFSRVSISNIQHFTGTLLRKETENQKTRENLVIYQISKFGPYVRGVSTKVKVRRGLFK